MTYAKFIPQILATIAAAVVAALLGDDMIDITEWINVAVVALGALSVFAAPNVPGAEYTKGILAAGTAALTLLVSVLSEGVTTAEWIQVALAAAGALGVFAVPNKQIEPGPGVRSV